MLSPAYDLNSTLSDHQGLLINRTTRALDLDILLASAGDYMLSPAKAHTIIQEVKTAMQPWRSEAQSVDIPQRDIEHFAHRFEWWVGNG